MENTPNKYIAGAQDGCCFCHYPHSCRSLCFRCKSWTRPLPIRVILDDNTQPLLLSVDGIDCIHTIHVCRASTDMCFFSLQYRATKARSQTPSVRLRGSTPSTTHAVPQPPHVLASSVLSRCISFTSWRPSLHSIRTRGLAYRKPTYALDPMAESSDASRCLYCLGPPGAIVPCV